MKQIILFLFSNLFFINLINAQVNFACDACCTQHGPSKSKMVNNGGDELVVCCTVTSCQYNKNCNSKSTNSINKSNNLTVQKTPEQLQYEQIQENYRKQQENTKQLGNDITKSLTDFKNTILSDKEKKDDGNKFSQYEQDYSQYKNNSENNIKSSNEVVVKTQIKKQELTAELIFNKLAKKYLHLWKKTEVIEENVNKVYYSLFYINKNNNKIIIRKLEINRNTDGRYISMNDLYSTKIENDKSIKQDEFPVYGMIGYFLNESENEKAINDLILSAKELDLEITYTSPIEIDTKKEFINNNLEYAINFLNNCANKFINSETEFLNFAIEDSILKILQISIKSEYDKNSKETVYSKYVRNTCLNFSLINGIKWEKGLVDDGNGFYSENPIVFVGSESYSHTFSDYKTSNKFPYKINDDDKKFSLNNNNLKPSGSIKVFTGFFNSINRNDFKNSDYEDKIINAYQFLIDYFTKADIK